jgi:hypothetical protein
MADVTIGAKLSLDAGAATKSMKDFKQEVKDARTDLLNMQATFGATSKEALNAAKKVAQLEDSLKDASETAKLFDPGNKFQVLGNAVRGLVGGFTALQGALALVGVEGEEVQKTLLKVQGALALTEGLNTVADVTKDFQRLGSVLVQTLGKSGLIGVAIVGVTALGLAISGVFNKKQTEEVQALNDSLKDYSKAAGEARQKTVEVKIAFEQARAGVISKEQALKVYNDTLGDSLGKTNDLGKAEKLLADKAEVYIKITALKSQANALFAVAAQKTADALIKQDELLRSGILDEGGLYGRAGANIKKNIDDAIASGKEIEAIGANLLRQAGQLSGAFNINTGTPISTKETSTPRAVAAKKEADEVKLIFSEEQDNKLQKQIDFENNSLASRKIFLEAAAADDEAAFQEKIALLNAELDSEEAAARQKVALAEWERAARVTAAQDIGNALGALSDLIGKETSAGKALAIAQAVINTWLGVTEVLKQKSVLPEPLATISRISSITTVIASGLNAVKNIGKAKVPGSGSAASLGGGSVAAPLQPRAPGATNTLLDQQQLNQIGNATVRAFVVESDVTNNQERIRRLNRASRI